MPIKILSTLNVLEEIIKEINTSDLSETDFESIYLIGSVSRTLQIYSSEEEIVKDIDFIIFCQRKNEYVNIFLKNIFDKVYNNLNLNSFFTHIGYRIVNINDKLRFNRRMELWGYDMKNAVNIYSKCQDFPLYTEGCFYYSIVERLDTLVECIWYFLLRVANFKNHDNPNNYHYIYEKLKKQILNFYNVWLMPHDQNYANLITRENIHINDLLQILSDFFNKTLMNCVEIRSVRSNYWHIPDNLLKEKGVLNFRKESCFFSEIFNFALTCLEKIHRNPQSLNNIIDHNVILLLADKKIVKMKQVINSLEKIRIYWNKKKI